MKNSFLGIFMLAGTAMFANNKVEIKENTVKSVAVTKCYKWALDDFGNRYLAQIPCPKVIIFKASEDLQAE